MQQLSSSSLDKDRIKQKIQAQFKISESLKVLNGCQILEDPELSETWLIDPSGIRLRKICGHASQYGVCLLPSGLMTDHYGKGRCKKHSRSALYNPQLNQVEGLPTRFIQLLQHVDTMEDTVLLNVDHEIKFFYTLQLMLTTMSPDGINLPIEVIEKLQSLTMDIVKTKAIKNKIQREMRLDASSIKEFIEQIFKIIVQRVPKPEAQNILQDIMNEVIVPYRNQARISGSTIDLKDRITKAVNESPSILDTADAKI
jgi:hypothetical protein